MAIAVFGDVHGNLEALEAILKHIRRNRKIKQAYFLGDAITFGPDSSACLKLLSKYKDKVKCVTGNHEQRMVRYDSSVSTMTYAGIKHMEYIYKSLDNDDLRFIKSMPHEYKISYKGFNVLFTHYSHDENGVVRDDYDEFTEAHLDRLFGVKNCDIVFFGHIHTRKIIINESGKSYVCNGSSGCVKGDKTFYTYFDVNHHICKEDSNLDIYRVNIKFNRKRFEEKMRTLPIPEKENFGKFCFGIDFNEVK
ncbi:MAG: metallophosphoesterase family protein [Firmicutes bacterium]|nr:metallophosphoesterase family protein [Bacillota bacterium]